MNQSMNALSPRYNIAGCPLGSPRNKCRRHGTVTEADSQRRLMPSAASLIMQMAFLYTHQEINTVKI